MWREDCGVGVRGWKAKFLRFLVKFRQIFFTIFSSLQELIKVASLNETYVHDSFTSAVVL